MKQYFRFFLFMFPLFVLSCFTVQAQTIGHRVYLLGNTVDIGAESNFYENFPKILDKNDSFTIIINGDLINGKPKGKITTKDSMKTAKLLQMIKGFDNGRMVIVPGDRDWANSGKDGWKSVRKLEDLIKSMNIKNVEWAIKNGCPGPELIQLNENLFLVIVSTQWWNHPYGKPDETEKECKIIRERDVLNELEDLIEKTENKNILVAGHFPLISLGEYGGVFPAEKHFFPPIIGSFRVAYRQNVGTPKDISNERFDFFRNSLEDIIFRKGSVIYAAGHEKNLQVLRVDQNFMVNSGAPVAASHAGKNPEKAVFSESLPGLVELVYYLDGRVDSRVHQYNKDGSYTIKLDQRLFSSACDSNQAGGIINYSFNPCERIALADTFPEKLPDSTIAQAGNYSAGKFHQFIYGKHYRSTWDAGVKVPYLNLQSTFGGLEIYEKGGGHQTTSFDIRGGNGREYAFRSVDKDPHMLLPSELQETIFSRILQDMTSMQQPYGAIAIGVMLNATEILHATPKLYLLPPVNELGPLKYKYGNLMGMLEEKPVNVKKVKVPFVQADEIIQSRKLFREIYKDPDNRIDKSEYARARMFDILVGDWGKHQDNWKWAGYKMDYGMLYRPIPRDRDYAFTLWGGILPYLADRKWGLPIGENFGYKINDIRSLTFNSQPADRLLLNELSRGQWLDASAYIKEHVTEKVIEDAVKAMPPEIYELSGKEIESKLKQRVKDLDKYAEQYYENLMTGGVDVVGSNKKDYFEVVRFDDASVRVAVFNTAKNGKDKGDRLYYERIFFRKETKEIRLFGLEGKDVFSIKGKARKSIKIRIIGGEDSEVITDSSDVKSLAKLTLIYEKSKNAEMELGREAKVVNHWNARLYNYDRHRFGYNRYLPLMLFTYNFDQGFGITGGVSFTRRKYIKEDYSSKHNIIGTFTTANINIINYNGRFRHVLGKWDVQMAGLIAKHNNLRRFYGIGNGTEKTDSLSSDFYKTSYDSYGLGVGLMRDFWRKSSFGFLVNYENNETQSKEGTILTAPIIPDGVFGLGKVNLVEISTELDLDLRDRTSLPEKGIRLNVKHQSGMVTSNDNKQYGLSQGFLEHYSTIKGIHPVTLGLKTGGSISYGNETLPFYKLKFLGQLNDLKGFQRNRFTGKSTLFFNSELRYQIVKLHTSFVPLKFGTKVFYDMGRVFSEFDTNQSWKKGYGVGLYLVPLTESFAINFSTAFSREESFLFLFSIGSTFK